MSVARATFAKSVTYTVTETQDPSSFEIRHRRRQAGSGSAHPSILTKRTSKSSTSCIDEEAKSECVRCRVQMQVMPSAARDLHYLVCPKCNARFASNYQEVFFAGAGVRRQESNEPAGPAQQERWRALRERAEAFHRRVDESDPYLVLGLDSRTPFPDIRAHYHDLASRHHPDHGGDPGEMRRIILAYERIRAMVARQTAIHTAPQAR